MWGASYRLLSERIGDCVWNVLYQTHGIFVLQVYLVFLGRMTVVLNVAKPALMLILQMHILNIHIAKDVSEIPWYIPIPSPNNRENQRKDHELTLVFLTSIMVLLKAGELALRQPSL